jgi:hypothetical protein
MVECASAGLPNTDNTSMLSLQNRSPICFGMRSWPSVPPRMDTGLMAVSSAVR